MARMRKHGVMAILICSTPFVTLAKSQARTNGVPDLLIVEIEHPLGGHDALTVRKRFEAAIPGVLAGIDAHAPT